MVLLSLLSYFPLFIYFLEGARHEMNRTSSTVLQEKYINIITWLHYQHKYIKQVAQRTMIAHLSASHQNILNSSLVKDFLNKSRAAFSAAHGWIRPKFKLIRNYKVVFATCKNEEDPIKNEGAIVLTRL